MTRDDASTSKGRDKLRDELHAVDRKLDRFRPSNSLASMADEQALRDRRATIRTLLQTADIR